MTNPLSIVHEGMTVLDRHGEKIGSVDWVKMTDDDPATNAPIQVTAEGNEVGDRTVLDIVAEAFRIDEIPEELRARLMRQGFMRMDADGIFASDRYVLPDQIALVSDQNVFLDVEKSALIKRH